LDSNFKTFDWEMLQVNNKTPMILLLTTKKRKIKSAYFGYKQS